MQIAARDKWRRLNEFLRWMFFAPTPFAAMHWALATWVPWAFPLPFLPVLPPPPAWPSLICCLSLCLHPRIHQNRPPTPPHLHLIRTKIFLGQRWTRRSAPPRCRWGRRYPQRSYRRSRWPLFFSSRSSVFTCTLPDWIVSESSEVDLPPTMFF